MEIDGGQCGFIERESAANRVTALLPVSFKVKIASECFASVGTYGADLGRHANIAGERLTVCLSLPTARRSDPVFTGGHRNGSQLLTIFVMSRKWSKPIRKIGRRHLNRNS